jgi:hypothetical protein
MNCLDFRRVVTRDPRAESDALAAHAAGCPACAQVQRERLGDDARLRAAMAVEVPAGLADRVLYARAAASRSSTRWRRMAVAAALVLAVGVATLAWAPAPSSAALVRHVAEERLSDEPADADAAAHLAARAQAVGGTVEGLDIRRVNLCIVGGRLALHLVTPGEGGWIDVLIVPGWDAPDRVAIDTADIKGWIAPARNSGLAVLGRAGIVPSEADLARIRTAVHWNPAPSGILAIAATRLRHWIAFAGFMR